MPFPSTRIWPSFALVATAILVPVATGLGNGLAELAGLAVAVEVVPPQAAASSAKAVMALVNRTFECMWMLLNRVS